MSLYANTDVLVPEMTSSVAEWLGRSFRVWEARVRFPAEASQRFQIGS